MKIIDKKTGTPLSIKIIFSFICPLTKNKYIAFDFQKNVFDKNSNYNNLDILKITEEKSNTIYVSQIEEDDEWENVKTFLQNQMTNWGR